MVRVRVRDRIGVRVRLRLSLRGSVRVMAGWLALPGHAMPIASTAKAMEDAVNIAAQPPLPGAAAHSSLLRV